MMYEIRLKPGIGRAYMTLVKPFMRVTHEWQSLAELTREVEQRVDAGHFEISERGGYQPAPFSEVKPKPEPKPVVKPEPIIEKDNGFVFEHGPEPVPDKPKPKARKPRKKKGE